MFVNSSISAELQHREEKPILLIDEDSDSNVSTAWS